MTKRDDANVDSWRPARESDLGPPVMAWLRAEGFAVFQEVDSGEGVADVLGTRGSMIAVVELKRQLSLEVIAQAARWRSKTHHVFVAVPTPPHNTVDRRFARRVLDWQGIGLLYVAKPGRDLTAQHLPADVVEEIAAGRVTTKLPPALMRRPPEVDQLRARLRPEHADYGTAGAAGGRRWTPYIETCHRLADAVKAQPGITLREAINAIRHHYSSNASAISSLTHWLEKDRVDNVKLVRKGKALTLWHSYHLRVGLVDVATGIALEAEDQRPARATKPPPAAKPGQLQLGSL